MRVATAGDHITWHSCTRVHACVRGCQGGRGLVYLQAVDARAAFDMHGAQHQLARHTEHPNRPRGDSAAQHAPFAPIKVARLGRRKCRIVCHSLAALEPSMRRNVAHFDGWGATVTTLPCSTRAGQLSAAVVPPHPPPPSSPCHKQKEINVHQRMEKISSSLSLPHVDR